MSEASPAIVLLSGGLDSATTLAIARDEGFACHALSFAYGQRHDTETAAAQRVAEQLGAASHRIARLDASLFAGSALTGAGQVPKDRDEASMARGIPSTYVPARNTVFLAHGLALAEILGAESLFMGVNAVDYSGYPDCRPEYVAAFQHVADLATKAAVEGHPVRIRTPLIDWPKPRIVEAGLARGVDFALTHSCYDPASDGSACGRCDACLLRQRAFAALGRRDPVAPDEAAGTGNGP